MSSFIVPSATQSTVEGHAGEELVSLRPRQGPLRREQLLLGLQHLKIIGLACDVTTAGQLYRPFQGADLVDLARLPLCQPLPGDQRVRDLPKRDQYGLGIALLSLSSNSFCALIVAQQSPAFEQRRIRVRSHTPDPRIAAGKALELGTDLPKDRG